MNRRLAIASVIALASSVAAQAAAPSQTGQGIWVSFNVPATLAIVNTQVWKFDKDTAAAAYINLFNGIIDIDCSGSPTNCDSTNQPATPSAPGADATEVIGNGNGKNGVVGDNQCTFLSGGTLTGGSYTKDVNTSGLNGRGNWKFTYHYDVTPIVNPVDPFTGWYVFHETNPDGSAPVSLTAEIAGESVVVSKQFPWTAGKGGKYSFSLVDSFDPLTGLPISRVQSLAITVDGGAPVAVGSTLKQNAPGALAGDPGAVDFSYMTNAGSNGFTQYLLNGDARTILNNDVHPGNNNGGADGAALIEAIMNDVSVNLGPGAHSITLTGTVKGNSASANISFSVTHTLNIVTPGCGGGGA